MSLISVFEEDVEEVTNPKNHAKPEEEVEYEEEEDEIEEEGWEE